MSAFPDVRKLTGKQNIFPKIPGARSANLSHAHEILHKQYLDATTELLISTHQSGGSYRPACPTRLFKLCYRPDRQPVPVSSTSHTALNLLDSK